MDPRPLPSLPLPLRAQRLSASRMNGRAALSGLPTARRCSTPFGITDEWTPRARRPGHQPRCAQRLSASRMNGHASRATWARPTACAQRLSASRMNGPSWSRGPTRAWCCAQRLSASRMNGLPDFCTIDPAGVCSTPFGITDEWTLALASTMASSLACSTPFGITDEWTCFLVCSPTFGSSAQRLSASRMNGPDPDRHPAIAGHVLNAFRHHG